MAFATIFAYAESTDQSGAAGLTAVLTIAFIVAVAVGVALVPIVLATMRRHRQKPTIVALAGFWALFAVLSVAMTVLAQMKYSTQHLQDMESGYLDPQDNSHAPPIPWVTWGALAGAYVVLLAWATAQRNPPAAGPISPAD